jgi:hypothetical protein
VLVAAWKTVDGGLNLNGVTLALTLARYFKRALFGLMLYAFVSLTDTVRLVLMVKGHHFRSAS